MRMNSAPRCTGNPKTDWCVSWAQWSALPLRTYQGRATYLSHCDARAMILEAECCVRGVVMTKTKALKSLVWQPGGYEFLQGLFARNAA